MLKFSKLMEAGDHFNNKAISKRLTSRANFLRKVCFALLAAGIIFSGCNKDNDTTFTVTFNSKGGSEVSAQTVKKGGKVNKPTNPTRENYEFSGWTTADNETSSFWDFDAGTVEADMTLYARWNVDSKGQGAIISGKFASQTGTGDAVFYADYVSAGAKSGLSATEKELVGKIEDGDIIFTLRGFLDLETNSFFLSAGSSILTFQITGTLINGVMTNTEAIVKIKSGNEWTVHTVSVQADAVTIDGTASNEQVAGIPTSWFGNWVYTGIDEGQEYHQYFLMTSYQFMDIEDPEPDTNLRGFLDIVPKGNGRLEIVWLAGGSYEQEIGPDGPGEPVLVGYSYIKIWLEESGQGLLLTMFQDSCSDSYATTAAYNTATANAESKDEYLLARP